MKCWEVNKRNISCSISLSSTFHAILQKFGLLFGQCTKAFIPGAQSFFSNLWQSKYGLVAMCIAANFDGDFLKQFVHLLYTILISIFISRKICNSPQHYFLCILWIVNPIIFIFLFNFTYLTMSFVGLLNIQTFGNYN